MENNLLIVGAGIYALAASEFAESMNCFDKIAFVDDGAKETPNGIAAAGTTKKIYNGLQMNMKISLSLLVIRR